MITRMIDGVKCVQRDVVYTDFGAVTRSEKMIAEEKSEGEFKTQEGRSNLLSDVQYSWDENNVDYEFESDKNFSDVGVKTAVDFINQFRPDDADEFEEEETYPHEDDKVYSDEDEEGEDREYSTGQLPTRLISLRRPVAMQLRDLYREHSRVYKSKQKTMKSSDVDLIMNDFRYELHRIIALAKDELAKKGGNMDTILRVSSIGGGAEVKRALMRLTLLFKRIEKAYETYGFIPRNLQVKLNDELSILISHFVLDIYGPEIEKRKRESQEVEEEESAKSK